VSTAVFTRLRTWLDNARARLSRRSPHTPELLSADTHPFDRRHRVDTAGLFYADQLATGHPRDLHSAGYYATAPSLIHAALGHWADTLPGTGYALTDYALLDLGCGKGRVLLLASDYPFRHITGIELHPGLADVARRNLRRWMNRPARKSPNRSLNTAAHPQSIRSQSNRPGPASPRVEVIQDDVLAVPFPPGPLVLFYFNSFEREIIEPFLDKLLAEAASRPDPMDLIYIHPEFGSLVHRRPGIRLLVDVEIAYSPEDAQADAFGTDFDRVAIYRLPPAAPHNPQAA
jgi:SAM-dependent methyltransferase